MDAPKRVEDEYGGSRYAQEREAGNPDSSERARIGRRAAFGVMADRYRPRLLKLVMRYMRNFADAEDVVQETFLKAYRALDEFRGDAALYSWLHRIAINAAKTAALNRSRRLSLFLSADDAQEIREGSIAFSDCETPQELALTEELGQVLEEALQKLPDEQRVAISLREIQGLSYSRVAETMSCPVGTVRSRIFRGREAINERLCCVFGGTREALLRTRRRTPPMDIGT